MANNDNTNTTHEFVNDASKYETYDQYIEAWCRHVESTETLQRVSTADLTKMDKDQLYSLIDQLYSKQDQWIYRFRELGNAFAKDIVNHRTPKIKSVYSRCKRTYNDDDDSIWNWILPWKI